MPVLRTTTKPPDNARQRFTANAFGSRPTKSCECVAKRSSGRVALQLWAERHVSHVPPAAVPAAVGRDVEGHLTSATCHLVDRPCAIPRNSVPQPSARRSTNHYPMKHVCHLRIRGLDVEFGRYARQPADPVVRPCETWADRQRRGFMAAGVCRRVAKKARCTLLRTWQSRPDFVGQYSAALVAHRPPVGRFKLICLNPVDWPKLEDNRAV